jgi:hypothetical protein
MRDESRRDQPGGNMSDLTAPRPGGAKWAIKSAPVVFAITVFASAALIFLVEPMIAKMVLPTLGGSPMVWNTCMAFFQAALLVGYLYAHLLQRVRSLKIQVITHAVVLLASALVLPLQVSQIMGAEPGATAPGLWLVGVLALSLGPPFAALSATAPLAQAWYARVRSGHADASNPYVLYAASNLGSLIALLAYPIVVEPLLSLNFQTVGWSAGYVAFILVMGVVAFTSAKYGKATPLGEVVEEEQLPHTITWKDRLIWMGLAAAPSSLMLGVTTHMTTDVASAPFLWVVPLALYLLTFILAFANRGNIPRYYTLVMQAALAIMVAFLVNVRLGSVVVEMFVHLAAFFFTALMCHTALADRRPHPSKLTEFYLLLAIGGVLGGGFNAFLAPVLFTGVWEYPLALILACLARPSLSGDFRRWEVGVILAGSLAFMLPLCLVLFAAVLPEQVYALRFQWFGIGEFRIDLPRVFLMLAAIATFLIRGRTLVFTVLVGLMAVTPYMVLVAADTVIQDRTFFGVLKVNREPSPGFSDLVYTLAHGTTLHGAQAKQPEIACVPLTYYAPTTPIGQVFRMEREQKPAITVGAVGMGAGTVASYVRETDNLRFYEIDQKVVDIATNPIYFTYISDCARGKIDWVLGDARLQLEKEPAGKFDILLVDAFSSDAVPAHLLTVEAMRTYLDVIKPDGVVIMHLSNRHLELASPVAATAKAAGGYPLRQYYPGDSSVPRLVDSGEEAIIVGHSLEALNEYATNSMWLPAEDNGVRAWSDDYTNLFGAMMRQSARERGPLGAVLRFFSRS